MIHTSGFPFHCSDTPSLAYAQKIHGIISPHKMGSTIQPTSSLHLMQHSLLSLIELRLTAWIFHSEAHAFFPYYRICTF